MSTYKENRSNVLNLSSIEQYSLIPELRKKEQWVCWTTEQRNGKLTKIPLNPHTGRYASSTDSETWSNYETAKEHVESNPEAEGLGFVFTEDGLVAGVDLDNVYDKENDEIEPWAADIIESLDSYTEFSPSKTGFHILLYGFIPGSRNREKLESTLERFDDAEVEMYDSGRFFTMSFDHIEGTPTELKQRKARLKEVHELYVAEEGDTTNTSVEPVEETEGLDVAELELTEEDKQLVEAAMNHDEKGEKFTALWNKDVDFLSEEYPDNNRAFDHSAADSGLMWLLAYFTGSDPVQMIRLFNESKLANRDKWRDRDDYRTMTVKFAIEKCDDVYTPKSRQHQAIEDAGVDLETDSRGYGYTYVDDGERRWNQVTNFVVETNAFVVDKEEEQVDLTIHPGSDAEGSYDVVTPWTVFNDTRKFRDEIANKRTTTFDGGISELNKIRQVVAHQLAPKRVLTRKLGLHDDEIVTRNKVIGKDNPTYRYVPQDIAFESKFSIDDDLDDYDEEELRDILELLPEIRNKQRGLPVLGWWYAALFSPFIREQEGELPHLGITGETGSGKTSHLQLLSQLIGLDPEPTSARTTPFSMLMHFAASTNIPLWIDEYKPSEIPQRKLGPLHDNLRKATRGADATRGNADKSETRYILKSPVAISGEQNIQGNAEQRRTIQVRFLKNHSETEEEWAKLTGQSIEENSQVVHYEGYDYTQHQKAIWNYILNADDDVLENVWRNAKEDAYEILLKLGRNDLENLEIISLAMVRFGLGVYQHFSSLHGATPDIKQRDIESALQYIINGSGQEERTSHVEEFLKVMNLAARDGYLTDDVHYTVLNQGSELAVRLDDAHAKVRKYAMDHDLSADLFDSPRDYRERFQEMEDKGEYLNDTSRATRALARAVVFDFVELDAKIDGFDDDAFY